MCGWPMMLRERLEAREVAGAPVRVGVIGAGRFGTMVICQLAAMRGVRPSVVADLDVAHRLQHGFGHQVNQEVPPKKPAHSLVLRFPERALDGGGIAPPGRRVENVD